MPLHTLAMIGPEPNSRGWTSAGGGWNADSRCSKRPRQADGRNPVSSTRSLAILPGEKCLRHVGTASDRVRCAHTEPGVILARYHNIVAPRSRCNVFLHPQHLSPAGVLGARGGLGAALRSAGSVSNRLVWKRSGASPTGLRAHRAPWLKTLTELQSRYDASRQWARLF